MRVSAFALLYLLASTGAAGALEPRIVNGLYTSDYPSVGALLSGSSPGGASLTCTGTMIGCRTFLTAAHCVCDGTGPECQPGGGLQPDPSRLFVFLQHAGVFAVESVTVRTDYDFPVGDVAVLRLADPVTGVRPSHVHQGTTPPSGTAGTIVGFGRQGDSHYDYGLKREGQVALSSCVNASPITSVCWQYATPIGPPGSDSNTCNGDSGGPLFVDLGGGPVLAGVTSGGESAQCTPPDDSFDANLAYYESWIAAQAGADYGVAGCGDVAQVGDPAVDVLSLQGTLSSVATTADWSFNAPAGLEELRVALNADDAADFDIYLRHGAPPTITTYDCKADDPNQFGACRVIAPASGTWYVLVRRFSGTGVFQVTASLFTEDGSCGGVPLGQPCDDLNACTTGDLCTAGGCTGTPVVDGTACNDGAPCTHDDACQAGACVATPTPRVGCHAPLFPATSTLVLRNGEPDQRDSLTWRWSHGAATMADYGTPTVGDPYTLCVYEGASGVSSVALGVSLAGGAGWKTTRDGYKYADRSGAVGGLTSMTLRAGPPGTARITVKAKGIPLVLPTMPLGTDPAVTIQLVGPNACFEARFADVTVNDTLRFLGRSQ